MKPLVETNWLSSNLDRVRIFDATWHLPNSKRNAEDEFKKGHIKGSLFFDIDKHSNKNSKLPHMMPDKEQWENIISNFGVKKSDHIIIYDNSDLYSSCRLWFALKYFGHEKVSVLDGGLKKWLIEKRSVNSDTVKYEIIKKYKVNEKSEWIKNKKQIDDNIKNSFFQTVDARSRERFSGKTEEPRPGLKKGCIVGSKNIPFQECIDRETNTFKTKSELINIFNKNDIDISKPIVFTCGSGMTACVLGMAYSLISGKNAVIYDGSWSEYGKK